MEKSQKEIPRTTIMEERGSAIEKYMSRAVGSTRYRDLLAYEIVNSLIRNFPGALGIFLRNLIYARLFGGFGKNNVVFEGVTFRCPARLFIGDYTVIDQGVYFDIKSERATVRIGSRSQLMRGVSFETGYQGFIHIGDDAFVGAYTILNGQGGIEIGKNSLIGGHCHLVAGNHIFSDREKPIRQQGFIDKGIVLEDDVWLGGGVTVLDGVCIGKGSIISAGAVVTHSVEPYVVMAGVPARRIKDRT